MVSETGMLLNRHVLEVQSILQANKAGFRKLPGTSLKNSQTGEVVYTPPQHEDEIIALMSNLEEYINNDALSEEDALIKMAVISNLKASILSMMVMDAQGESLTSCISCRKNCFSSRFFI